MEESFFVYIIQSEKDGSYYKGSTQEPLIRLRRHNNGESTYSRNKTPWRLVYLEEMPSKRDMLIREKGIKSYGQGQIKQLIQSGRNCLQAYLDKN